MKNTLFVLLCAAVLFAGCRSSAYFDTPNSLRNVEGTVFLANGKNVDGKIVINSGNMLGRPVKVYTDGDRKPMQFSLSEITGYKMGGDYFALKEIRGGLIGGRQHSFMKRISPPDSRIHLYENIEKTSSTNSKNMTTTRYETQYFLQFPGDESATVWDLSGSRFVPNFDEKMSKLLADCPTLAARVRNKEQGYFYAQVTMFKEKRADVLLRIIQEYNECGKTTH